MIRETHFPPSRLLLLQMQMAIRVQSYGYANTAWIRWKISFRIHLLVFFLCCTSPCGAIQQRAPIGIQKQLIRNEFESNLDFE